MTRTAGEMPFLDHLEELRGRLLKSLAAVVVGVGIGFWFTLRYNAVAFLAAPVAPYLEASGGKLTVLALTDPFLITMKFGAVIGLVLASPVLIYQAWAFLSPALYARERKAMMPALVIGLLLFLTGAWLAWEFVMPRAVPVLLGFQAGAFNPMITYDRYFSFVMAILLGLGLSFELPLVMIVIAALGIMTGAQFNRFRRYAVLLACVAGALLSPGGDALMMLIFTVPLLLLYEIGVAGAYLVGRKRVGPTIGAVILFMLLAGGAPASVQAQDRPPGGVQVPRRLDPAGVRARTPGDTTRGAGQPAREVDSATAKRLGLPTRPSRLFPGPDSVMQALMARPGFAVTRYMGDSAVLHAADQRIILSGEAATDRDGSVMEADQILYDDQACSLVASGEPRLFEEANIAIGRVLRIDTCRQRVVLEEGFTTFDELGANWFVRGNLAVDSSAKRLYAAGSEFTSCDLPLPHYEFRARHVKWVAESYLVARPAVLYVRDVPIVWLPFLFMDTKAGRRSGILIPQFGFNDIVRPTRGYNRQVSNIGYYWAPNDYVDLTIGLDWFSSRYIRYGASFNYRWLDRFIQGGVSLSRQVEVEGSSNLQLLWNHSQQFSAATSLQFDLNYVTNSRVLGNNSVDPLQVTQQIRSSASLRKQFGWGNASLGGRRQQNVSDGSGTMQFPSLSIQPRPVALSRDVTWSPSLTILNDIAFTTPLADQFVVDANGIDTLNVTGSSRSSSLSLDTPLRFGRFNLRNRLQLTDRITSARRVVTIREPDLSTPDPTDSISVERVTGADFASGLDWDTGLNLPVLLSGSIKLQPTIAISNVVGSAPFLLRSAASNGEWVQQAKRVRLSISAKPDFFGFFNHGVGPFQRFRHRFSPQVDFSWQPEADVPDDFSRALGRAPSVAPPKLAVKIGLAQTFEGKPRLAPGDSTTDPLSLVPVTLLSITTSPFEVDFEQGKLEGKSIFVTQTLQNRISSDLIPGFTLAFTHDLWEGAASADTAHFSPFLSQVTANFSITGQTVRSLLSAIGLADAPSEGFIAQVDTASSVDALAVDPRFRPGSFASPAAFTSRPRSKQFRAAVTYTQSRSRTAGGTVVSDPLIPGLPDDDFGTFPTVTPAIGAARSNVGLQLTFAPTTFWGVQWDTQYNITDGQFESHRLTLTRELHDWEAQFNVVRSPNGNFSLYFNIALRALPEIKFDYNQSTIER
jgi:Tat protein translocase TatC